MKSIIYILLLLTLSLNSYAQTELSTTEAHKLLQLPSSMTDNQINDIVKVSKVWGFTKYHHPAFASQEINADREYFSLLNKILNQNDSSTNELLLTWIKGLGNFETKTYRITNAHIEFNPMNWVTDTALLGKQLSQQLIALKSANRNQNQYVEQTQVNIKFIEPEYKDIPENDIAYKLLSVAKFWNAIDNYSPNRNLTNRKWEEVLPIYIEQACDTTIDFMHLYSSLASELNDSHANSWLIGILGPRIIPIVTRFVENRMFVYDTCSLVPNELQIGDEIISINGTNPIDKIATLRQYNSYSNQATLMRDAAYQTLLTPNETEKIVYRRNGVDKEIEMQSIEAYQFGSRINSPKSPIGDKSYAKLEKGVAYINLGKLKVADGEAMFKCIKKQKNLIIDLRAYPEDYFVLHQLLPQYFFSEKRQACTMLLPLTKRPGYCRKNKIYTNVTNNPEELYEGNIAILVDEGTQSRAEYFAMFLQTIPNAITIGSCTAGADGDVTHIGLPYASWGINFTGSGILYPDGANAQRQGIKIDYEVAPTIESIIAGKDEVLTQAIAIMKKHFDQ